MKKWALGVGVVLLSFLAVPNVQAGSVDVNESLPMTRHLDDQKAKAKAPEQQLHAAAAAHSVTLTWTQSPNPTCTPTACPVTANQVLRGTTSGGETVLFTSTAPVVTYVDSAVTAGTTYFYQVTAVNSNGPSGPSNEVSAVIPNQVVPNPPTGLTAVPQ